MNKVSHAHQRVRHKKLIASWIESGSGSSVEDVVVSCVCVSECKGWLVIVIHSATPSRFFASLAIQLREHPSSASLVLYTT